MHVRVCWWPVASCVIACVRQCLMCVYVLLTVACVWECGITCIYVCFWQSSKLLLFFFFFVISTASLFLTVVAQARRSFHLHVMTPHLESRSRHFLLLLTRKRRNQLKAVRNGNKLQIWNEKERKSTKTKRSKVCVRVCASMFECVCERVDGVCVRACVRACECVCAHVCVSLSTFP